MERILQHGTTLYISEFSSILYILTLHRFLFLLQQKKQIQQRQQRVMELLLILECVNFDPSVITCNSSLMAVPVISNKANSSNLFI
jgi:hypothetical protein